MSIEKLNDAALMQEYKVSIAYETIQELAKKELLNISTKLKRPGFRPGKVPMAIIESQYSDSVKLDVAEKHIKKLINEIISSNKLDVIDTDVKTLSGITSGKVDGALEVLVKFDLFPVISLPDFSQIPFENIKVNISDEKLNEYKNIFLDTLKSYDEDSKNPSANGDMVIFDCEVKTEEDIASEPIKDLSLVVGGSGPLGEELEKNFLNVKNNDELNFEVKMPKGFGQFEGKICQIKALVKGVKLCKVPNFDKELAAKMGLDGVEKMQDHLLMSFQNGIDSRMALLNKIKLFDSLESLLTFEVPEKYLVKEKASLKNQLHKALTNSEELENYDDKTIEKIALRRLRVGMMIDYYGEKFSIELNKEEYSQSFSQQIMRLPENIRQEAVQFYIKNPKALKSLMSPALENKIINDIISKLNVVQKECSVEEFEGLMKEIETRSNLI